MNDDPTHTWFSVEVSTMKMRCSDENFEKVASAFWRVTLPPLSLSELMPFEELVRFLKDSGERVLGGWRWEIDGLECALNDLFSTAAFGVDWNTAVDLDYVELDGVDDMGQLTYRCTNLGLKRNEEIDKHP